MINNNIHTNISWNVIHSMFKENSNLFVEHHISSYNSFFSSNIKNIFKDNNPSILNKQYNDKTGDYNLKCDLYFGGKDNSKIYYGKPTIYDDDQYPHLIFPNEARLKNKTYGFNIYYDIDVILKIYKPDKDSYDIEEITLSKICLGKFPIMLKSNLCILNKLTPNACYNLGECINDKGGYFIIDGKEKVIVCQEQFANNTIYIKSDYSDIYSHNAEIRSVSEDSSKPVRVTSIKIVKPNDKYTNNQIVVAIPNVRKPIPLFIVFRALGILSDKRIIQYILLNLERHKDYIDLFIPSIHDSNCIFTQDSALKYISTFTKHKTIPSTMNILINYFLPHIGEYQFDQKALFLGHMTFKLLKVFNNVDKPTDRDSFKYKRIETAGSLLYNLFREYYQSMLHVIVKRFDNEYYYKNNSKIYDDDNFGNLIKNNYKTFFSEDGFSVQKGFMKAFKGQWGSKEYTSKEGIVQDLNRLSYNSALSHCRKLNLPLSSTAKVVAPRLLHASQWGFIDPVDTPDGGHIGLHKHLAISTRISDTTPLVDMVKWILNNTDVTVLTKCSLLLCDNETKIFINGSWIGMNKYPYELLNKFNIYKRNGLIPILSTISFNIQDNLIEIFCDSGRLTRPIFYMDNEMPSYHKVLDKLNQNKFTWNELLTGFIKKNYEAINYTNIYKIEELYNDTVTLDNLTKHQGILDFIDSSIMNTALININDFDNLAKYTHIEIHPSLLLGVMGNQIIYPNQNPLSRDLFSCGQSKQAVSLYSSNYQFRTDKMGVVLNYGQIPIIKSKYLSYINNLQHPYGENVIVAIMSYNGYNVEDSILFNKASIDRGLFRTTYFTTYEDYENSSNTTSESLKEKESKTIFANVSKYPDVLNMLNNYEYHHLDDNGIIKENTVMHDKIIIIGKISESDKTIYDQSIKTKKGQLGLVDKVFVSENEQGHRLAKVRIREERIPSIGDKFCSRCGQKGTIGLIIPEENMPFSSNGLKPDIIINPHAIPSRMTIGQLIETIVGKASLINGTFANCTAFEDPLLNEYSKVLTQNDFHSHGEEILYDGLSGQQINANIFIGPTYYMRLKHMVKDKINYRASGPKNNLTRQTVQGRANDGGLRIGEMERDAIICHGMTSFLKNSLIDRGDKFYMAICNNSGTIAIYNKVKNILFSPYVDGPVKFDNIDLFINKNDNISDKTDNPLQSMNELNKISYTTKFGKDFSIVQVPFCFKLLMQELLTMNIQMRLITSDNIETLTDIKSASKTISIDKIIDPPILDNIDTDTFGDDTDDETKVEEDELYNDLDKSITKHTTFTAGQTVYLANSDTKHPWAIEKIDNTIDKSSKNITIFTVIDKDIDLPPGSIVKNIKDDKTNASYKYAMLNVNVNDIIEQDEIIKYAPYIEEQIKKYTQDTQSNDLVINTPQQNYSFTPNAIEKPSDETSINTNDSIEEMKDDEKNIETDTKKIKIDLK